MATANISSFHRGDTRTYKFTFTDAADTAVDITGWVLWMTLKAERDDIDANAAMQVSATMPVDADSTAGIGYLVLSSTDTDVSPDTYYYDIQRVITGTPPRVSTLKSGKIKVMQDITVSNS